MQAKELKFLLQLLGHEGYRAPIGKLAVSEKASASERDKLCRELGDREIVDYSRQVSRFKISSAGKALLKLEGEIPLTEAQVLVVKMCASKSATPGDLKKIPAGDRQSLIQELEAKGLIESEKAAIKEVWLTERGAEYLREECHPSGTATISLRLLGHYLNFMRKGKPNVSVSPQPALTTPVPLSSEKPSDDEILQTIRALDHTLGTDNYLPIFHLRQTLQPPLSRDELDQALYRLQRQDKLELSALVEAIHYSSEQVQAGIPQDAGGPLFFLIINDQ